MVGSWHLWSFGAINHPTVYEYEQRHNAEQYYGGYIVVLSVVLRRCIAVRLVAL